MAPTLYHGLDALRLPVICIESRQAYQALKSLGTHKTDRNDIEPPERTGKHESDIIRPRPILAYAQYTFAPLEADILLRSASDPMR